MKRSIVILLLIATFTSFGQNNFALNQQKYWDYRNRLKKLFMVIGVENGNSLTYNHRFSWPHKDTDCMPMEKRWLLSQYDNPIYQHGTYLTILATEYALLKRNKQDVTELLNELYFALNALERIDKKSDKYLLNNNFAPDNFDGNLLRTDIDFETDDDWELHDTISLTKSKSFNRINGSDYFGRYDTTKTACDSIIFNNSNILSIDEVVGLMIGFRYVLKYIDNIEVQPDPSLPAHKLLDWVKEMTEKIADQWSSDKAWIGANGDTLHGNWLIRNPAVDFRYNDDVVGMKLDGSGKIPIGGHAWLGIATPLAHIFSEIVGKTYSSKLSSSGLPFVVPVQVKIFGQTVYLADLPVGDPVQYSPGITENGSDAIWRVFTEWPASHYLKKAGDSNLQIRENAQKDSLDYINGTLTQADMTAMPKLIRKGIFSYLMLLLLMDNPSTSSDFEAIHLYSSAYGFKCDELMFKTLYPEKADSMRYRPRYWYDSLLNDAPVTHNPEWNFDPNNGYQKGFIDSRNWGTDDIFTNAALPGDPRGGQLAGFKNGMDYMALYNMYHLIYLKDSLPYREGSCDCWPYRNYIHDLSNVTANRTITGMHPGYHAIGIEDRNYINKPAIIKKGATLISHTSLDVCSRPAAGNGYLRIEGSWVQGHYTDIQKAGTLTIKPYNDLIVGDGSNGGTLEINPNNSLYIKPEATCHIDKNSNLTVLGKMIIEGKVIIMPGGKLLCNGGKLELRKGAELIINDGGVLELDNQGNLVADSSLIYSEGGSTIHLSHASILDLTNKSIYKYAENASVTLDHLHSNFKIDCILLLEHKALFTFNKSSGAKNGYITFGRSIEIQTKGENQKVELHGNGIDTYLRLEGNPIFREVDHLSGKTIFESVVLGDGTIESIPYGGMQVYAPFEFARNFATGPGKIMLMGQQSCTISQNIFDSISIDANLGVLGNSLEIDKCTFTNGAALILKNGVANIHHTEFAAGSGLTIQTMIMAQVHDCIFNNASVAISGNGSSGMMQRDINYYFEKCDFVKCSQTAFAAAHASITMKCCLFKGNHKALDIQDSYINMSRHILTNSTYIGGDNVFINNVEGLTVSLGGIYINNGGNSFILSIDFAAQTGSNLYTQLSVAADYDFKHDTSAIDLANCLYKSDNNFWYPRLVSWRSMEVKKLESICITGNGPHPPIFSLIPTDTSIDEVNNTCLLASNFRYQIVNDTGLVKVNPGSGNIWSSADWHPTVMPNPIGGVATIAIDNSGNDGKVLWLRVIRIDGTIARDNIYISAGPGVSETTLSLFELNNGIYKFLFINTNNTEEVVSRIVIKNN